MSSFSFRVVALLIFTGFRTLMFGQSVIDPVKWKVYKGLNEPDSKWTKSGYADHIWQAGVVPFGVKEDANAFVIPGKSAYYFRNQFEVVQPGIFDSLRFQITYEAGVVCYLNGSEIFRAQMPEGIPGYSTNANSCTVAGNRKSAIFSVPARNIRKGKNVVAVEVHTVSENRNDIFFNLNCEPVFTNAEPRLVRGPYLQSVNHNSCTIVWRTDFPTDGKVMISDEKGYERDFYSNQIGTEHCVLVSGLTPGEIVNYRVGSSVHWIASGPEYIIRTAPSPGVVQPVRIWALGDFGNGSIGQQQVLDSYLNYLGSSVNDMWIWLGDNAYYFGLDSEYSANVFNVYKEQFKSWNFYPAPGNHDYGFAGYQSASALTTNFPYFDIFHLPENGQTGGWPSGSEKYYSFNWSNIHFIALDSYGAYNDSGSPMYKWLEEDLRRNGQRWTLAYWHHPPYSMGSHNSDTEIEMVNMRNNIVPLLEKYGVDMVLTGHSHTYERSYFIRGHYGLESTFDSTMLVQPGDGSLTPYLKDSLHQGVVYLVCGVGGQLSGAAQSSFPHDIMAAAFTSVNGSSVLDIDHDTLRFKFLRSDGIIADSFTMIKSWNRQPAVIESEMQDATVFPNPTTGQVTVVYSSLLPATLKIIGPDGRLIQSERIQSATTIDLSRATSGIYVFVIENEVEERRFRVLLNPQER